jgi:transcriptional regulator NrdR family protein
MRETNDRSAIPNAVIPNPDPSQVTSEAIDRAVSNLEKAMTFRIEALAKAQELFQTDLTRVPTSVDRAILGLRETLEARILATEKTADGTYQVIARRPAEIHAEIGQMHSLIMSEIAKLDAVSTERFARIDTQFIERDKRTDQLSLADKTAVAAALQAAKEAVGAQNTSNSIAIAKSESSTVESIRQLQALFTSAIAAVNEKINDLRSRIDRGDGNTTGSSDARTHYREERTDQRGLIFGIVGAVLGCAALVATFMKLHP